MIKVLFEAETIHELDSLIISYAGLLRQRPEEPAPVPSMKNGHVLVATCEFSVRTARCLKELDCTTLGEIADLGPTYLLRTKGMGRKSVNEVGDMIRNLGLPWASSP